MPLDLAEFAGHSDFVVSLARGLQRVGLEEMTGPFLPLLREGALCVDRSQL